MMNNNGETQMTPMSNCATDMLNVVVGMGYVPEQEWGAPHDGAKGLERGTIFPCLDKPFAGGGGR